MRTTTVVKHGRSLLNHLPLVVGLSLIVPLTSCVTVGRKFDLRPIGSMRVGETAMAEVRSLFGNPLTEIDVSTWGYKRMHFGDEDTKTIWRYMYGSGTVGSARSKFLQVEFDEAGTVADYYYSSGFRRDRTEKSRNTDFDIFEARDKVVRGTTKSEVMSLLGSDYRVVAISKPGTSERWHYGFTGKSKDERTSVGTSAGEVTIKKIYGKSLDIDFDSSGIVTDIRGESDFPADKDRFFTKGQ